MYTGTGQVSSKDFDKTNIKKVTAYMKTFDGNVDVPVPPGFFCWSTFITWLSSPERLKVS